MISSLIRTTLRLTGAATRSLWGGSTASRSMVGLATLVVFLAGSSFSSEIAGLAPAVLLIAGFVLLYGLVIRGR